MGRQLDVELVGVGTTDSWIQDKLIYRLGGTGTFIRAPDERVLNGEVDTAVRSMKNMPTEKPTNLVVTGMPRRAPAGGALVTAEGHDIDNLPEGAVVDTSSLRRQTQLLNYRDDLEVGPLRGSVDTRIEKLPATHPQREYEAHVGNDKKQQDKKGKTNHDETFNKTADEWFEGLTRLERQALSRQVETEYDTIVLAETGLKRSGLTEKVSYEHLPRTTFVLAPGQGVIAMTATDSVIIELIRDRLDHPRTRVETTVKQTILAELGGGYIALVGIHTLLQDEHVHVGMQVLAAGGSGSIKASRDLPVDNHANAAREFAAALCDRGAGQLINAAHEEAEE